MDDETDTELAIDIFIHKLIEEIEFFGKFFQKEVRILQGKENGQPGGTTESNSSERE